jgi:hypothetical protein
MIIDLFSGSGSASYEWENNGYKTFRFDIVIPSQVATLPCNLANKEDIDDIILPLKIHGRPLLIWASPPCTEYSLENRYFAKNPQEINTKLWRNTLYIIDQLNPIYYVIENVKGAHRIWGQPTQKFGAYWLWGRFPKFNIPYKIPKKGVHKYTSKKIRAQESAMIPYCISNGLYRAITLQHTLFTP